MIDLKYSRPYCERCKLIYSSSSILYNSHCTSCKGILTLKSFNPWPTTISGVLVLGVATATVVFSAVPIIWIGGFIFGAGLMVRGFNQWKKIEEMDKPEEERKKESEVKAQPNEEVVTCGGCGNRNFVKKGLGYTELICKKCGRKSRIFS